MASERLKTALADRQLMPAPSAAFNAVWMPDSRRIAYTYDDRAYDLHLVPIDASAPDRVLLTTAFDKYASSISPDGCFVLFTESPARKDRANSLQPRSGTADIAI